VKIKLKRFSEQLYKKGFMAVFSVILALIMWFLVVGNQNEEIAKTFEVRLEMLTPPTGLSTFTSVKNVAVTLKGRRRAVNALENQALVSQIDLKGLSAGTHTVPVSFRTPSRMKLTQIAPANVEVTLTRVIDKSLAVKVLPPENLPRGYVMDGATVSPTAVTAHGREDELQNVFEVYVRPTFEQLKGEQPIHIALKTPSGVNYSCSPSEVTVDATYSETRPRSEAEVVVETRGTLPSYLVLKNPIVSVPNKILYEGRANSLKQIYTEAIDLSQVRESTTVKAKLVNIPAGVSLFSPAHVDVHIDVETIRVKSEFSGIPVTVRGTSSNDHWIVEPDRISVFVLGDAEIMKNLTPESLGLHAYVDVSGMVTSSLFMPIVIEKKSAVDVEILTSDINMVKVMRQAQ